MGISQAYLASSRSDGLTVAVGFSPRNSDEEWLGVAERRLTGRDTLAVAFRASLRDAIGLLGCLPWAEAQQLTVVMPLRLSVYPLTYRLQASTDLLSWVDITTNGPFAGVTCVTNTVTAQGWNRRFFRLVLQ